MKFKNLRVKCEAKAYRLIITAAGGQSYTEEINLDYTVEAGRKLGKLDEGTVLAFRPTITQWPHGYVNTLEVEIRE